MKVETVRPVAARTIPDARKGAPSLLILGVRGVPAAHGGFETFAAELAPYLVERGWRVGVYCQIEPNQDEFVADGVIDESNWRGVRRIRVHTARPGALGTAIFDWRCYRHARREPGVLLVLGYNTAVFALAPRLGRRHIAMNMDGIEWRRGKWSLPYKVWFYVNELVGANIAQTVIADHPEIERHVRARAPFARVATIPYGAHEVETADPAPLGGLGLKPDNYFVSIARIEPENSIHTLVEGFAARNREARLVVLGNLEPEKNAYHAHVKRLGGDRTLFPGAIYDPPTVSALRMHAIAHLHGHTVGGTNPSLVEALGAGSAVIAHRNRFNVQVCGPGQRFFSDAAECDAAMTELTASPEALRAAREAARARHAESFRWSDVLGAYATLLADAAAA